MVKGRGESLASFGKGQPRELSSQSFVSDLAPLLLLPSFNSMISWVSRGATGGAFWDVF
jgi:hypothetical protein